MQESDRRLVRVAGRLSVAQVPELLGLCAQILPLQIDLTELVSADVAGIEALQRLRSRGAALLSAPEYLQLKLDSTARADEEGAIREGASKTRRPKTRDAK